METGIVALSPFVVVTITVVSLVVTPRSPTTFVFLAVFNVIAVIFVAISEAIEELKAVVDPEIAGADKPFIRFKLSTSVSMTAPAAVTLVVSAVSLVVFVATSEAIEELKLVEEPVIAVRVVSNNAFSLV